METQQSGLWRQLHELQSMPAWTALRDAVRLGEAEPIVEAVRALTDPLQAIGLPRDLLSAITVGWRSGEWDDAVEQFGRMRDQPVNAYVGPMRAQESDDAAPGLLLLARTPGSTDLVAVVEERIAAFTERVFGADMVPRNRHIEFYDVLDAVGPFARPDGDDIALFTPFYLGGWCEPERQNPLRRTLLFRNVVARRLHEITVPFATRHLRIDGMTPRFLQASEEEETRALILWLTLHELIHASGPLPLFGAPVAKLSLGLDYGAVEELRVDATIWLALGICEDLFGSTAVLARDIVLGERILRSATASIRRQRNGAEIEPTVDAEHGAFWLATAVQVGSLAERSDAVLDVDTIRLAATLSEMLSDLYQVEEQAGADPPSGAVLLREHAHLLRRRLFIEQDGHFTQGKAVQRFLAEVSGSAHRPSC